MAEAEWRGRAGADAPVGASSVSRQLWPDWAKGLGIILVVFGHVWRGLLPAGIPIEGWLFQTVDRLIYAFHMPVFFFVSGLFFHAGLVRRPPLALLWSRVVTLLWPLAIWTWIFFAFKAAVGQLANTPVPWSAFPLIPLPPREEFWFLWALFLVQAVLILVLRPVVRHAAWRLAGWGLAYVLALLLAVLQPGVGSFAVWLVGAYSNAPYFILGVLLSQPLLARTPVVPALAGAVVFLVFEGLALVLANSAAVALLVGTGATLGFVLCLRGLEAIDPRGLGWLARLGQWSLAIYVAHVIFSAATRILLLKLGVESLGLHLLLGVATGVIGPLVLLALARRAGLLPLLGWQSL